MRPSDQDILDHAASMLPSGRTLLKAELPREEPSPRTTLKALLERAREIAEAILPQGRGVCKAAIERGREAIEREAHWRRTKHGALAWVRPHELHIHKAIHGEEPDAPKDAGASAFMGRQAMQVAIATKQDVVHAMYRNGLGWIDFPWGLNTEDAKHLRPRPDPHGLAHILEERDAEHAKDPQMPDGFKTSQVLPDVIAKGRYPSKPDIGKASKLIIEWEGYRVIIARTGANRWLLSGFKLTSKNPK